MCRLNKGPSQLQTIGKFPLLALPTYGPLCSGPVWFKGQDRWTVNYTPDCANYHDKPLPLFSFCFFAFVWGWWWWYKRLSIHTQANHFTDPNSSASKFAIAFKKNCWQGPSPLHVGPTLHVSDDKVPPHFIVWSRGIQTLPKVIFLYSFRSQHMVIVIDSPNLLLYLLLCYFKLFQDGITGLWSKTVYSWLGFSIRSNLPWMWANHMVGPTINGILYWQNFRIISFSFGGKIFASKIALMLIFNKFKKVKMINLLQWNSVVIK